MSVVVDVVWEIGRAIYSFGVMAIGGAFLRLAPGFFRLGNDLVSAINNNAKATAENNAIILWRDRRRPRRHPSRMVRRRRVET